MSDMFQRSIDHITSNLDRIPERSGFIIKEVIFNDPVTVVNWADGKKTIVRCQEGDTYDERTGLLLCIAKRMFGNKGKYNDVLNKWCPEEDQEIGYDQRNRSRLLCGFFPIPGIINLCKGHHGGQDGGTDAGF